MKIERWHPEGITPVELWNRKIDGQYLFERVGAPRVSLLLEEGKSRAEIVERIQPDLVAGIEHLDYASLYVAGGLGVLPWTLDAEIPPQPQLHARRARVFADVVADVGQTSVKVFGDGVFVMKRDPNNIPVYTLHDDPPDDYSIDEAAWWIRSCIRTVTPPGARKLLLGLPTSVSDDLVTGDCTYAGWNGSSEVVPQILRGLPFAEVQVVNDAELAALSAPHLPRPTLVITLGFAIGGALID